MPPFLFSLFLFYMENQPMLVRAEAELECDNCGVRRTFNLDPPDKVPAGWSLFDLIMDTARVYGIGWVKTDGRWFCDECDKRPVSEI